MLRTGYPLGAVLAVVRHAFPAPAWWLCAALCASMVPVRSTAQTRLGVQYFTNTLAATPTNFFGSNVLAGSGVTITRGPQGQLILTAVAGSVDTNAFQPASGTLTNLAGTGALTNGGAFQPGHVVLTNLSGTGALTNASGFQPGHLVLTNLTGTGALTNRVAAAGGLLFHTNAAGLLTVSNAVAGGASIDTNAFQPAHVVLTNLSGTGALTNAGAFQPGNLFLTNISGTGALTNANAFQPAHVILTNLTETGALTNQSELNAKQFGSLVLTNLSGTGAFTNLLAADGGLVLHTDGVTVTVSNSVTGGGGSGETNFLGDAGLTNNSRFSLVYDKQDITNRLKTITSNIGLSIQNQGTNLNINTALLYQNMGGGMGLGRASAATVFFNTIAADGGLVLHSNANLLTFSNSFIAQPASEILTNLSGTGALTNQGELDGKQFGSQILTNLSGTGALTNGTAFQPAHEVLTNISGTGALTNLLALSNLVVLAANGNDATAQPGRMDLPYGSLTNALAAIQDNGTLLILPGRYPAAGRFPQAATIADRAENPVALSNRHNVSIIGLGRPVLWQTNQGDFLTLMNCQNIAISGIRFEGTRTNLTAGTTNPAPRADALLAFYQTNNGVSITDCSFSNHMHFGIHDFGTTDSTANHVTIDNCEFDLIGVINLLVSGAQSGHAISFGGNHWKISNSRFRTCFRGIQAASTTIIIRDVQIRGNTFVTNINNDIELAGDGITDAQIVGNHMEGSASGNTKRSIDLRRGERVLVQGNTIMNMPACEAGIRLLGAVTDVSVVDNFMSGTYFGILMNSTAINKVRVAGNHIRLIGATAIYVFARDGIVIEGNHINNITLNSIQLVNSGLGTNYIVRNNLIYDVGTAVTDNAILIGAGVDTATIEDNIIFNTVLGITDSGTATRINEKILSRDGTRNVRILSGTGSPEGVVSAHVGSLYARTDGGYGTTHYSKTNGTGNTGWGPLP